MPRDVSAAESSKVLEWIEPVLKVIIGSDNVNDQLVRKLAHFLEYCLLGTELSLFGAVTAASYSNRFSLRHMIFIMLGIAFSAAFLDETIQIFSARGPAISDVWLDFTGAVTGMLLGLIMNYFFIIIKKDKKTKPDHCRKDQA